MNNVFITQYFDWNGPGPRWVRYANGLLKTLGVQSRLVPPQATGATTCIEQRINMYHLLSQVLAFNVPGAVVEVGVDRGTSATLMQKILVGECSGRELHLYDLFPTGQHEEIMHTFARLEMPRPCLHVGWIQDTLPAELPAEIAFAHIDLGPGDSTDHLRTSLIHALASVYPRLAPGGICLIADYCDSNAYRNHGYAFPRCIVSNRLWNVFPVVKEACDQFLADKPVMIDVPYSGEYSHAYFRRARPSSAAG